MKQFTLATLAIAVSVAISTNAFALENEKQSSSSEKADKDNSVSEFSVTTTRIASNLKPRANITGSFSERTMEIMSSEASSKYLQNPRAADSATFPMRLINKLNEKPWINSPSFPIRAKDMACFYGVPSYRYPQKFDSDKTPVVVTADKVSGKLNDKKAHILTYTGNVEVTQGDKILNSDIVVYDGKERTLSTKSSAVIHEPEYTISSDEDMVHNLDTKQMNLTNAAFILNGSVISGTADKMNIDNKKGSKTYKGATISGCPVDKRSWHFYSTTFKTEKDAYFGDAWNDVLFLGKVPVFYTPYAQIPLTKKRHSGLLPVSLEYKSGEGISYSAPIYLNLATNYDATVTPGHDAKRGNIYDVQFRYLPFNNLSGEINATYLPNDPHWSPKNDDYSRWFINIYQTLSFLENDLNFSIDYSKVRNDDYTYLSDISQKNAAITDSSLQQSFKASYDQDLYDVSLELRKYQNMFSTSNISTYRPFAMLPQLKANTYNSYGSFYFKLKTEATHFSLDKMKNDMTLSMNRLHAEPSVRYLAYEGYGTSVDMGLTGFLTHYSQSDLEYLTSSYKSRLGFNEYKDSVTRALYLADVHAKSTFEKKVLDMNHTQTLEPEFKYQYIPYKDQSNIALYDTTNRYDDYYTLFSPHRYAGIDRIANINMATFGLTSRLLDAHDREVFRAALAQGYNFSDNRVKLRQSDTLSTNPRSPLEALIDVVPFDGMSIHTQAQYNPDGDEFYTYSGSARYTDPATGYMLGVSYRYYKDGNYYVENYKQVDLKQLGLEVKLPISSSWTAFAASYKDIEQSYNIDTKFGLKYDDCCYAVTLLYENYMNMDWKNMQHTPEKLIGVQFELKDLFAINVRGITDPNGTGTHYLPSLDPTNLNR